jgi:hypothetical protein
MDIRKWHRRRDRKPGIPITPYRDHDDTELSSTNPRV